MDVAYVEKLENDYRSIEYLLSLQDMFGRNVHAKGRKAEDPKETVSAFSTMKTESSIQKWSSHG